MRIEHLAEVSSIFAPSYASLLLSSAHEFLAMLRNSIELPTIGGVAVNRPKDQPSDEAARANWVADNFINKQ
ncbi:unnamed protein product [Lasius platythorax]|uniref:Uncharacterized protein n=1 Tax=Lasius platythorax TaxID=488582 RepID=A0AAV2NFC2_9HYME